MKPTREQIENATPDELNVWVAEMMGWRWLCHPNPAIARRCLIEPESVATFVESDQRWIDAGPEVPLAHDPYGRTPDFSTDIAAAWQVVDWLTRTTKQTCTLAMFCTGCEATFETNGLGVLDGEWKFLDLDAPLAICRAALLRWIEQPITELS